MRHSVSCDAESKCLSSGYRPDIQGLRAIAVIVVILSHAGIPAFAGGFVGVDVFFVLSGFLITGLLLQEHERDGRVSLGRFYLRRLRRLLPTLFAVIVVSVGVAYWLLPEADSRLVLGSIPFAATWTSNVFFTMRDQDYFNELGDKDLFLHTWSLGVEEQFYLLWPVLLLVLLFAERWMPLRRSLLVAVVLSFIVSVTWTYIDPISAFYMMPSRIWQFGLGGLVYIYAVAGSVGPRSASARGLMLLLGIALILGAAVSLSNKVTYPGFLALLPSIGAALVIFSGSGAGPYGWLASAPLVWLGDRSYSLYLWHYPVIVLAGLLIEGRAWLLAFPLMIILSSLSYRWVELPFWKVRFRSIPPRTFVLGSSAAVLFLIASAFHVQQPPAGPSIDIARSIRSDLPDIYQMNCDAWFKSAEVRPCVLGHRGAPNTAVLLADSIGAQWVGAWEAIFPAPQWRIVVLTKSSCPIVDEDYFYPYIGKVYEVCRQWRDEALANLGDYSPNVIVVGSSATYEFSNRQWIEGSRRVLGRLVAAAEQVVLVSGTPRLAFDGPGCIARHMNTKGRLSALDCVGVSPEDRSEHVAKLLFSAASTFPNVQVINPADLVCPGGQCRAISPSGVAVFRDSAHLTDTYVRSMADQLKDQLKMDL